MLETVTEAQTNELIALSSVKMFLRLAVDDASQDAALGEMIRLASGAIVDYLGRGLGVSQYRETTSGLGGPDLLLGAQRPVVGVPAVTVWGSAVTDFVVEDREAGILRRQPNADGGLSEWEWSARLGGRLERRPIPGTEQGEVVVNYLAGFRLPNDLGEYLSPWPSPPPPRLPATVERAAWRVIAIWAGVDSRDPGIASRTAVAASGDEGPVNISFHPPPSSELPESVACDLLRWQVI